MKWCKNTLKRIGKYVAYTFFLIFSLVIIGVVTGITLYALIEHSNKKCDENFIYGCISAGLSEEVCKDKIY